jgi:hypothetical protein
LRQGEIREEQDEGECGPSHQELRVKANGRCRL